MAARRIFKSSVNWPEMSARCPKNQREYFKAFKTKSDSFLNRIYQYPENLQPIDWSAYRGRIAIPDLVDKFEKQYASLKIPYPDDKSDVEGQVDQQIEAGCKKLARFTDDNNYNIAQWKATLDLIDRLPSKYQWTMQLVYEYFPDKYPDPDERPTMWPHTPDYQPGYPGNLT